MRTLCLTLLLILNCAVLHAQRFESLDNNRGDIAFVSNWIHALVRHTSVSPKYTGSYSGFTINASFHINRYEKWSWRYDFENPTLGDMIYLIFNINKKR